MKQIGRIYRWVIISVLLQLVILLFLNNYYLQKRNEVRLTSVETEDEAHKSYEMKIKDEASNITVSFDGHYAAYTYKGSLHIIDIHKKKELKTIEPQGNGISYFRWVPDRSMLVYSFKPDAENGTGIQINTYEIDTELERKYPEIKELPKDSEVQDIELSALTNIVYVKINTSRTTAEIYKFNIMNNLNYVMDARPETVIMETNYSDNMLYKDSKNRIFVKDGMKGTTKQLAIKGRLVLLGVDSEDRAFVGVLDEDDKVTKIHYGKVNESISKYWNDKELESPVAPENITVTRAGKIYVISEESKKVVNILEDKEKSFHGRIINIIDDYLVTLDGEKLKLIPINSN